MVTRPGGIVGRGAELRAIDERLGAAREGVSGALVIRGEAGIGKSTLLKYAISQAGDEMKVLSARGFESESEIPFAGLADLLRPVLDLVDMLPAPQAAALQSAMSLGPPAPGDRFSVCAATLGMLAAAAADQPVLVVIDDLHWVDVSSREAVLFAARRLQAEGVALLLAARPATTPDQVYSGLAELEVRGLDEADADALFLEVLPGSTPDLRSRIYADTAGNPLGIRELSVQAVDHRAPAAVLPSARVPAQSSLTRALETRLGDLGDRTRQAMLLVAAGSGADTDIVLRAAAVAGLELADFAPAERSGLLEVDERRVRFRHPLLRTVLYGSASMHERSTAHGALAQVLAEVPGNVAADGRAWHLAAARVAPDEEVAHLLTAAGGRARRRGGQLEAARAYEQAARFAVPSSRAALLLRAARCWQLAGRNGRILPVLEEALPLAGEPRLRARIRHMSGYVRMWRELPADGLRELTEGAREVEEVDAGQAALMYADAGIAYFMHGAPRELIRITQRAYELGTQGRPRLVATVAHAGALVINGHRAEGQALLETVRDDLLSVDPLAYAQELAFSAYICMWLEDDATAGALIGRVVGTARDKSAIGVLPQALAPAAELSLRTGHWVKALAEVQESLSLAAETRQTNLYGLYFQARIDAVQGRGHQASALLNQSLKMAVEHEAGCVNLYVGHVLGLIALGEGELDEAISRLETVRSLRVAQQTRDQSIVPWAFDLVEAYARAGRTEEADSLLAEYAVSPASAPVRSAWLEAMTHRCRGLLSSKDLIDKHFEAALEAHARCEMPFERARTLLAWGERLRRFRQRGAARLRLHEALEIFEQLDATPWATRARAELVAAGENADVPRPTGPAADLTPQELQVALVVAGGASNQEAAASLFLSPKTIEYHLSNIYRKTNLRSRGELTALVA